MVNQSFYNKKFSIKADCKNKHFDKNKYVKRNNLVDSSECKNTTLKIKQILNPLSEKKDSKLKSVNEEIAI